MRCQGFLGQLEAGKDKPNTPVCRVELSIGIKVSVGADEAGAEKNIVHVVDEG
jgi:hypothetical protein